MKTDAFIVDVDGTVAITGDRGIYDWSKVHLDTPNRPIIRAVRGIYLGGIDLIYCSGRMEQCRYATEHWLKENVGINNFKLFMRKDGDYRGDTIIKEEIYRTHIEPEHNIILVIDDRDPVTRMWRSLGLTCLQVAEGNF